jgi:hypothetical protein
MSDYDKYLYSEYEKHMPMSGITFQASEAFNKLQTALGNEYTAVMEAIEGHYNEKAFQVYKSGYNSGMRFLTNKITS